MRMRTRSQSYQPQTDVGRTWGDLDPTQKDREPFRIRITTNEEKHPSLSDISTLSDISIFLWDLVLLHDRLALAFLGAPSANTLSPRFVSRGARRLLESEQKLRLTTLAMESPLIVEVALGVHLVGMGIGVGWGILKVIEKIRDIQIKGEQLANLRRQNEEARKRDIQGTINEFSKDFRSNEYLLSEKENLEHLLTEDADRLAANRSVRIVKVEVVEYR